jgi:hypothetical protein
MEKVEGVSELVALKNTTPFTSYLSDSRFSRRRKGAAIPESGETSAVPDLLGGCNI